MRVTKRRRPPRTDLSVRAREILAYIEGTQARFGAPPTLREIGSRFGIRSTNGVHYHLELLARAGAIRRRKGRARGIAVAADSGVSRISNRSSATRNDRPGIPILGRISAGGPLFAQENIEGRMGVEHLMRSQPDFALRVQGDSMRDAGILPGDVVLVRRTPDPHDGEIVVALIGDEATIKRLRRLRDRVELHPENPAYAPIVVTPESLPLRILGRVVGVYREMR